MFAPKIHNIYIWAITTVVQKTLYTWVHYTVHIIEEREIMLERHYVDVHKANHANQPRAPMT